MSMLYLIRTGRTTWEDQHRLESAAAAPLDEQGVQEVQAAVKQLAGQGISIIYACAGEAENHTARMLADSLDVKLRNGPELRELDYGLWQGLTTEELKRRHPKTYRQWLDAPTSVRPPGGESLEEACQRLRQCLKDLLRRHRHETMAVVLRPVAAALARCILENRQLDTIWQQTTPGHLWYSYPMDKLSL